MKNFSTWMLLMFVLMFWAFRVLVALFSSFGSEAEGFAGIVPFNSTMEIILIFVVLLCVLLIIKRKILGAVIYLIAYGSYFGMDAFNYIKIIISGEVISAQNMLGVFLSIIGIILPIAVLLDMLMDKARIANPKDKKTDWFYQNENFDREFDERADRNNYRL